MEAQNLWKMPSFDKLSDYADQATKTMNQVSDYSNQAAGVWGAIDPESYEKHGKKYVDGLNAGTSFVNDNDVLHKTLDYSKKASSIVAPSYDWILLI